MRCALPGSWTTLVNYPVRSGVWTQPAPRSHAEPCARPGAQRCIDTGQCTCPPTDLMDFLVRHPVRMLVTNNVSEVPGAQGGLHTAHSKASCGTLCQPWCAALYPHRAKHRPPNRPYGMPSAAPGSSAHSTVQTPVNRAAKGITG